MQELPHRSSAVYLNNKKSVRQQKDKKNTQKNIYKIDTENIKRAVKTGERTDGGAGEQGSFV